MRTFLSSSFLVLMLLGTLAFAGCGDDTRQLHVRQLQVDDVRYLQNREGERVLRGTVTNPAPESVRNVQIEVSLLDADNRRIETALIAVNEVPAGGHTPFRQVLDADGSVRSVRIRHIRVL